MSKKTLLTLSILVVLLFVTSKSQLSKKQTVTNHAKPLVSFDLGAVKTIVFTTKQESDSKSGDKIVTLQEISEGKWISLSSNGYEAQTSKVNALILSIHGLKSNQKITSNPKNYSRLGLGDKDAMILMLQDKDKKTLASLQFGKSWETPNPMQAETRGGRYVRVDPFDPVYLVSQDLNLSMEQNEWLNTQFLKIEKKDIADIQLLNTTPRLSIVNTTFENKDLPPTFSLQGIQPGDKAKDWVVDQVVNFFSSAYFTGVFPATDSRLMKAPFQSVVDLKTKDGILYHVFVGKLENDFYLKLTISSPETPDAKPSEKASKLNDSYTPWIYKLESWTAATLNKSYKDLIEEIQKPKVEEAQEVEIPKTTDALNSSDAVPEDKKSDENPSVSKEATETPEPGVLTTPPTSPSPSLSPSP